MKDLRFLQAFKPEMVGIGPFIPHHDTIYADQKAGSVDLTLRLLLYKAQSHAASEVRLRCPAGTEGFFTRLGFRGCASAPDGTEMTISGDRIDLDTCKGCPKTNCPGRK